MPQCQFLFFTVFLFQKSCTGNILGIGWNNSQTSYLSRHEDRVQSRDGGGHRDSHTIGWRGPTSGHTTTWCGPLGHPPTSPFCLYIASDAKNPKGIGIHPRKVPQRRHHQRRVSGDRGLCFGTLPGWGIAPEAISIISTAIFIVIADSHDEEGVVLPRGWGFYR
jgi:hypothetical protein